ncbi:guanitoxin biosynthesis pre-guanitoxin forming N-methyltransferase GntF [Leptothoe sp. PORK10 BA2]|uniref:guanitoxin biosynthesis pre-guanitoxin forming N-methyltransferase GntF n=1 Tax=Leptothoe sp. PORK10 BA2 TaxID=3110254 RepID=UPI002B20E99B|nr:guanitoxin biosynthesis pre-guanitoxin forming N-methyltransferase GntF [Leptothoe sp. PORK10 BA2]MEA5463711.1 guanitoxin biosynthesis pre-guanitoxin forming N-methyltransferase GntF [Leptothoe sp. PORK10 BA2]
MQAVEINYSEYSDWDPKKYLQEYYSDIMPDEQYCLEFLTESLKRMAPVPFALDFGSGPIISHIIPLVTKAQVVHVSEYIESNLLELKKWLSADKEAYDWRLFTQKVLQLEGNHESTAFDVQQRESEVRKKVTHVIPGDVRETHPLGESKHCFYPLVTAHYCAEGISLNKDEWRTYMRNIMSMVQPGGTLITSACGSGNYYRVGESCFPSTELNPQDVLSCFLENGFVNLDIRVRDLPEYSEQGFFYTIFACGVKASDT